MIKALLLIFEPIATWERIWRARRGILFILVVFLLPLLLLTTAAEGYGLVNWGKWQVGVGRLKKFSLPEAAVVETIQFLLSLLVVFAGTSMINSVAETFRVQNT